MVCFIILHYNTITETEKCISSIEKMEEKDNLRIVIVDNASPNGSGMVLKKKYKGKERIVVLIKEKNDGFSAGNNEGCKYAIDRWNPDFIVIANNDVEFRQRDLVARIQNEYKQNHFAVLGPDIYNPILQIHQSPIAKNPPDRKRVNITIWLNRIMLWLYPLSYPIMREWFHRIGNKGDSEDYQTYQENVCLMGACLIYSRDYTEKRTKIFEPETMFYYEENIQSVWCFHNQIKIIYQPSIEVWHMDGRATKSVDLQEKEQIRFRMRNILQSAQIYRNFLLELSMEKDLDYRQQNNMNK